MAEQPYECVCFPTCCQSRTLAQKIREGVTVATVSDRRADEWRTIAATRTRNTVEANVARPFVYSLRQRAVEKASGA